MPVRLVLATLLLACSFHAGADDKKVGKIDARKLIGKWEPKDKDRLKFEVVIEYTKDGKVIFHTTVGGKEAKTEGTYKVESAKLTYALAGKGKESAITRTIQTLTDTELVTTDEKGMERRFVRLKDK